MISKPDAPLRAFGIGLFLSAAVCVILSTGCTYNRNAPLLFSEIQINDSANNNEIPLIK